MQAHQNLTAKARALVSNNVVVVPPVKDPVRLREIVSSLGYPTATLDENNCCTSITVAGRELKVVCIEEIKAPKPGPVGYYKVQGDWVFDTTKELVTRTTTYDTLDFEDTVEDIQAYLNRMCDATLGIVDAGYTVKVVASWAQQRSEAEAYLANPATPAPLLRQLAKRRDISIDELAQRVMQKVTMAGYATGDILGIQQLAEDQLAALVALAATGQLPTDWFDQCTMLAQEAHASFAVWHSKI